LLLLRDVDRLMERADVASDRWERRPAMDPMVSIRVDESARVGFGAFLASLSVGGAPITHAVDGGGLFSLEFGHADDAIGEVTVGGDVVDAADLGLERVRIEDEAGSSAYHIPQGSLFVYDPRRPDGDTHRPEVSTTAIAPAILAALGVDLPAHHTPDPTFELVSC
jgi:hypothetical protein